MPDPHSLLRGAGVSGAIGVPRLPIPQLYLRTVLALLAEAGTRLQGKRSVSDVLGEDAISNLLKAEMDRVYETSEATPILWDLRVDTQYDPEDPQKICEIDFKFRWSLYPDDTSPYLAVEAKKLHGIGYKRADKYVDEGVMDFVLGKYGRGHDHGIMLGYVVVGPIGGAVSGVTEALASRRVACRVSSDLAADSSLCPHPHTHCSTHLQHHTDAPIRLVHLFLDLS